MSKKVFTILLLAVFMLAQFSVASAAEEVGTTGTLVGPAFLMAGAGATVTFDWTAAGLTGAPSTFVDVYARVKGGTYVAAGGDCAMVANIVGDSTGSGTYTFTFPVSAPADGQTWEFLLAFDNAASCTTLPANAAVASNYMASAYVDGTPLEGMYATPPYVGADLFGVQPVACNTFENWALASDTFGLVIPTDPYSGFGAWNAQVTGTFAGPAPIGAKDELLSWPYTLPSTAVNPNPWSFSIDPEDAAGNKGAGPAIFRNGLPVVAAEVADCATFTDVSGHADELYIRYLADLGLISGFADGTYGPDTTLSRAEAATLFEISNGVASTDVGFGDPPAAGSACEFTDVLATDWFAGWVWRACADGYMNGIGGGLFDPNNLLTRGQIVTIMNNVALSAAVPGGFLAANNVMQGPWGANQYRTAAWTDVSIGAYYATPIVNAYSVGVAEGTSATTFSPDQAVTRGEFAKMLYRGLSEWKILP